MASEIALTHSSGLRRKAYVGWSWTSFFFGGFPALFRGDFFGFFVWFVVALVLSILTYGIGGLIFWLVWSAIYNRWHTRRLIERGYQITGAAMPLEQAKLRILG